jgi:hypothetical protein
MLALSAVVVAQAPADAHHGGGNRQRMNAPNWAGTGINASVVYFVNTSNDGRIAAALTYVENYVNQFVGQGRSTLIVIGLGAEYNGYVACGPGNRRNTPQPYDFIRPICWDHTFPSNYLGTTINQAQGDIRYTAWSSVYLNMYRGDCWNDYWCLRNSVLHEVLHSVAFNAGHSADPGSVLCGDPYPCYTLQGVQRHMNNGYPGGGNDQQALFNIYLYPYGENGTGS